MTYKDSESIYMKRLFKQIFRFGIVGGISTGVDFAFFVFATEVIGVPYYISNVFSFLVSLVVNYILSMKFVFEVKGSQSKALGMLAFCILSIIGLVINQMILIFLTKLIGIYYVVSKVIAVIVVMVWNFVSKKIYFECCNP